LRGEFNEKDNNRGNRVVDNRGRRGGNCDVETS